MHQCYSVWHRHAKLDKFYVCIKISTLVQHQQCYCWWCFKAANALQSYLALRCVVHHPSPNSAASTSTPPLCGAVPSTTTPGSNVNLLQINIWLWTNYNAFFCISIVGTSCSFTDGRKLMKYSEVWPHFWIVDRWIVEGIVLVIEKGWKNGGVGVR